MGHVDTAGLNDDFSRISNRTFYTQTDACEKYWNLHREKYKFLVVIIEMLLVFPTSSPGVERVFSATAWQKNERRNRMLDDLLNANLHVKLNTCKFDYSVL